MAEDDIYGSKGKYERFKKNLSSWLIKPENTSKQKGVRKYYCKIPTNLKYFEKLFRHFEAKDISYIHRARTLQSMVVICYLAPKDLAECTRDDINQIVAELHAIFKTPKSKESMIKSLKYIWKILFPEKDAYGRVDESIPPYVVRHLSGKSDKSRQRLRTDKLSWEEFERLVDYFSNDPRMQAYLTLSLESLARPQELLYVKIGDVELYDNYAKIWISEHGKEGVGLLQCIDSYPYLLKWLDFHPLKKDKNAFLFVNTGGTNHCHQLKPQNINKMIHQACRALGIDKPITCYSLKRNGVTIRRLRGESDMEIQHAARWTSTDQLRTYDLTNQEEAFKRELEKRGLIPATNGNTLKTQKCDFCNNIAGFGEIICQQCRRPLARQTIREEVKQKDGEIQQLREELIALSHEFRVFKAEQLQEFERKILKAKNS